jgi:predicted MFS family arabinose efflux permease
MSNTWKIYMLTFITFLLGTAQFVIVGILDKVAASVGVSVSEAGQLITVFALANAVGTPVVMVATAKVDQRKRLLLALAIMLLGIVGTVALPGFDFLMLSRAILVVNTYITPFLTSAMRISGGEVSVILFAIGIASLIGSKLGGLFADRIGTTRTLVCGMVVQALALALLSFIARATFVSIPLLMFWVIAAWTFMPPQNFNLISIAPEASGIMLSLNNSFVQFGFAAGAAIGSPWADRRS